MLPANTALARRPGVAPAADRAGRQCLAGSAIQALLRAEYQGVRLTWCRDGSHQVNFRSA